MKCGLSDDMIGLGKSPKKKLDKQGQKGNGELDLNGIDEDEIDQVFVGSIFVLKYFAGKNIKLFVLLTQNFLKSLLYEKISLEK